MNATETYGMSITYAFLALAYVSSFLLSILGFAIDSWIIFASFKSLFMPCIAMFAYLSWGGHRTKHYYLLQLAFLFAWLGDVILALPQARSKLIIIGGFSFFFQHVFYIWLNLTAKEKKGNLFKTRYWGLPSLGYIILFSLCYWSKASLIDKVLYVIYSATLGTSFYTSFYRESSDKTRYWTCILGFGLFVISDILIIIDQYIIPLTMIQSGSILVTYYLAQTFICYTHVYDSTVASAPETS